MSFDNIDFFDEVNKFCDPGDIEYMIKNEPDIIADYSKIPHTEKKLIIDCFKREEHIDDIKSALRELMRVYRKAYDWEKRLIIGHYNDIIKTHKTWFWYNKVKYKEWLEKSYYYLIDDHQITDEKLKKFNEVNKIPPNYNYFKHVFINKLAYFDPYIFAQILDLIYKTDLKTLQEILNYLDCLFKLNSFLGYDIVKKYWLYVPETRKRVNIYLKTFDSKDEKEYKYIETLMQKINEVIWKYYPDVVCESTRRVAGLWIE